MAEEKVHQHSEIRNEIGRLVMTIVDGERPDIKKFVNKYINSSETHDYILNSLCNDAENFLLNAHVLRAANISEAALDIYRQFKHSDLNLHINILRSASRAYHVCAKQSGFNEEDHQNYLQKSEYCLREAIKQMNIAGLHYSGTFVELGHFLCVNSRYGDAIAYLEQTIAFDNSETLNYVQIEKPTVTPALQPEFDSYVNVCCLNAKILAYHLLLSAYREENTGDVEKILSDFQTFLEDNPSGTHYYLFAVSAGQLGKVDVEEEFMRKANYFDYIPAVTYLPNITFNVEGSDEKLMSESRHVLPNQYALINYNKKEAVAETIAEAIAKFQTSKNTTAQHVGEIKKDNKFDADSKHPDPEDEAELAKAIALSLREDEISPGSVSPSSSVAQSPTTFFGGNKVDGADCVQSDDEAPRLGLQNG